MLRVGFCVWLIREKIVRKRRRNSGDSAVAVNTDDEEALHVDLDHSDSASSSDELHDAPTV
jgi:hypothetical protein